MADDPTIVATREVEKMNPAFYTLVLDYNGGTYIRQVNAVDVLQAVKLWIDDLARNPLPSEVPVKLVRQFAEELSEEPYFVVPIQDVQSCWYASVQVKKKLVGLNIIRTI